MEMKQIKEDFQVGIILMTEAMRFMRGEHYSDIQEVIDAVVDMGIPLDQITRGLAAVATFNLLVNSMALKITPEDSLKHLGLYAHTDFPDEDL